MNRRPIIVTRAGEPGEVLTQSLADAGEDALWLPAFTLGPAPDERRVTEVLGKLAKYQLAVFVSPAAVEAVAARLRESWPKSTALAAVGEGTRRAILARIPATATLFAPEVAEADGEGGGSELLWLALQPVIDHMRHVLILRAEHGREWLSQQMAAAGAEVETVAVYTRRPTTIPPAAAERICAWQTAGQSAVLVVASSEAVETVVGQLDQLANATWTRSALALASHDRIAQRLRRAGFTEVKIASLDVEAIRKAAFAQ